MFIFSFQRLKFTLVCCTNPNIVINSSLFEIVNTKREDIEMGRERKCAYTLEHTIHKLGSEFCIIYMVICKYSLGLQLFYRCYAILQSKTFQPSDFSHNFHQVSTHKSHLLITHFSFDMPIEIYLTFCTIWPNNMRTHMKEVAFGSAIMMPLGRSTLY